MKSWMIWIVAIVASAGALVGGWAIGREQSWGYKAKTTKAEEDLVAREGEIADLKKEAGDLKTSLYDKGGENSRLNKEIRRLEDDLAAAKLALAEKNREIARLMKIEQEYEVLKLKGGNGAEIAASEQARKTAELLVESLKKEIEAKDKEIADLKQQLADHQPAVTGKLAVKFGKWDQSEAVTSAKWNEMGGASRAMRPAMAEVLKAISEGRPPDPALVKELQKHNATLIDYYLKIRGKIPTNAPVNGEFAHPITFVNLAAAQLAAADKALTEQQIATLTEQGEEYEKRWDKLQKGYTAATPQLVKLVDEIELKQWFADRLYEALTAEQRAELWDESVRGRVQLDLYSPGTMLVMGLSPLTADTRELVRGALLDRLAKDWGIERTKLDGAAFVFDRWLDEVAAHLEPAAPADRAVPLVSTVLVFARAQLKAAASLKEALNLDEAGSKAMRDDTSIYLMYINKK
ncbi:MAG: hypothetical protein IT462_06660 [Planctomycetes bacterium]|nr:hypothetical protein [Planctomycetota bacterium]